MVTGDRTARDIQRAQRAILDGDKVLLLKRTTGDIQRGSGVIAVADQGAADHGTGRIRLPIAGVVAHGTAFDGHCALVVDDVVGGLTRNTLVITLDGTGLRCAGVPNGDRTKVAQRSLSRTGATVQGLAVQVEGQILACCDLDILVYVSQQGNGLTVLRRHDGVGQRPIGRLADLRSSSRGRLDYAIGGAVSIGLDLEAVSAIVVGHLARKRTGGDVEVSLISLANALIAIDHESAADIGAAGCNNDFFLITGPLDSLLEQALVAIGSADIGQRHSRRLGHHDSRLLGQAFERGALDVHSHRCLGLGITLGVHLCAADAGEGAAVQLNIAALNPQVVQAWGGVGELAVIKHRLAVLVVAHAIGERAVGVRHGVLRRVGVAQNAGEVVGHVADTSIATLVRAARMRQFQVLKANIEIITLIGK